MYFGVVRTEYCSADHAKVVDAESRNTSTNSLEIGRTIAYNYVIKNNV